MAKKNNNIELSWGNGKTRMFLNPLKEGGFEILDYELDHELIHEMCGGKCYYVSQTGKSGAGFIKEYGQLIPVGYYRVDTKKNNQQFYVEVAKGINVMIPYVLHKSTEYPLYVDPIVVTEYKKCRKVIYCDLDNLPEVLKNLIEEKEIGECKLLTKTFVEDFGREEEVKLEFYQLTKKKGYNPWHFATDLGFYMVDSPEEDLYKIFKVAENELRHFVHTTELGGTLYATKKIKGNPFEECKEAFPGWYLGDTNLQYRFREKDVYIVNWSSATKLFNEWYEEEFSKHIAHLTDEQKNEARKLFEEVLAKHNTDTRYFCEKWSISKVLFFQDKEKYFEKIKKALKEQYQVKYIIESFVERFNKGFVIKAMEQIADDTGVLYTDCIEAIDVKWEYYQKFKEEYFLNWYAEATVGHLKKGLLQDHNYNYIIIKIFKWLLERKEIEFLQVKLQ